MEGRSEDNPQRDESRASFPSGEYLAARIEWIVQLDEDASEFEARRARAFADLERRIAEEPGVIAVTFADRAPGTTPRGQRAAVETSPGAGPAVRERLQTWSVGGGFFEAFDRPIVLGRAFHEGDRSSSARTVIVNEAFAVALIFTAAHDRVACGMVPQRIRAIEPDMRNGGEVRRGFGRLRRARPRARSRR